MGEIVTGVVGSFISCYICTVLITSRLLNRREYFKLKNFIIILLAIPILKITGSFNMAYKIIAVIVIYTMVIKLIYDRGIIISFIIGIFAYSIVFLCDVVNSFIYLIVFKVDINHIQHHMHMIYIMHFSFFIIALGVSLFIKPKDFFSEVEDFILRKNLVSIIQYIVFFITFTGLLGYVISVQPYLGMQHIASVALLILFIVMNVTYFWQIKISTRSKYDYDNIYNYTGAVEKLAKQLTTQEHEYKNRLTGIQALIENKQYDDAAAFINQVMNEQKKYGDLLVVNYDRVYNTVLKKLMIEKTSKALNVGIKINAEVREDIKDINISNMELNDIISIIMDNAIDAADNATEKLIEIMMDKDEDEISIVVSNTYGKAVEEAALYLEGASSKGKFRGNGLHLLKQIEDNNQDVIIDTTVTEELFIQEIRITNTQEAI